MCLRSPAGRGYPEKYSGRLGGASGGGPGPDGGGEGESGGTARDAGHCAEPSLCCRRGHHREMQEGKVEVELLMCVCNVYTL